MSLVPIRWDEGPGSPACDFRTVARVTTEAPETWRPTADSFRNLALFWAVLGTAAAVVTAAQGSESAVAAIGGSVILCAAAMTAAFGRKRVVAALAEPIHPALSNWPPDHDARRRSVQAGWLNAAKAAAIGAAVGAVGGTVPAIGFGLIGAGFGGAVGGAVLWRLVRRYESANDVTVLTASRRRDTRTRTPLILGVAARPTS